MKKFLPAIFIAFIFVGLLVSQMLIHGQKLSASRMEINQEKYSVFESEFHKLKDVTSRGTTLKLNKSDKNVIILNFWASWCRPCISEFDSINQFIDKFGDKVKVIGINNDTDVTKKYLEKLEKKHGLKFESILDPSGKYAEKFNVLTVPYTIAFYKGKVFYHSEEEHDYMSDSFIELVESKLNQLD